MKGAFVGQLPTPESAVRRFPAASPSRRLLARGIDVTDRLPKGDANMLRKGSALLTLALATVTCQDKLWDLLYYFHWLWGGKH